MSFRLQPRKKRSITTPVAIAVVASLLALTAVSVYPTFSRTPITGAVYPVWIAAAAARDMSISVAGALTAKAELAKENDRLRGELSDVSATLLDRNLLLDENLELRELLGRAPSDDVVAAAVLARPSTTPYDTFILDAGSSEGIAVGDRVFVAGSVIIGWIENVQRRSSQAKLYSAPGTVVTVDLPKSRVSATAHGRGGGAFTLKMPRDVPVAIGDPVAAPGIGATLFGTVVRIEGSVSDAFQTVYVLSPVNEQSIRRVLIERAANK